MVYSPGHHRKQELVENILNVKRISMKKECDVHMEQESILKRP